MRLIVIGWQAAVPPTVCTIAYVAIYLLFTTYGLYASLLLLGSNVLDG
jgi:hypothetical protein